LSAGQNTVVPGQSHLHKSAYFSFSYIRDSLYVSPKCYIRFKHYNKNGLWQQAKLLR